MRPIDADAMLKELKPIDYEMEHSSVLISDVSNIMRNWVNRQPTLTLKCPLCYSDKQRHNTPPNEPLPTEQLREMDGEPVWLETADGAWALVDISNNCVRLNKGESISLDLLSEIAYRYPPKRQEDNTNGD